MNIQKHVIIFCVSLFIALFSEPVSVLADEVLPSIITGAIKAKTADSADQIKKKADLKLQVFNKQNLHGFSIRGTFSSIDALGKEAPEEFRQYDVAVIFKLPWSRYAMSGWGVGTRVMTSAGVLSSGSEETALLISVIPQIVFGDMRFALDMGAGGAALSEHRFGEQDFGESLQFALTAGISIPLYKKLSVGYRFLHYSDGGIYGSHTTGADIHTAELICRF